MRKIIILVLFVPLISFGQSQSLFGEKFIAEGTKDLIESKDFKNIDQNIKIKGKIKSTCKMKGCWMELDVADKTIFVRFKNYGFFVPKDLSLIHI